MKIKNLEFFKVQKISMGSLKCNECVRVSMGMRGCVQVCKGIHRYVWVRISFGFLAEKTKKRKVIQNFTLNHIYFNHFSKRTCQKKVFNFSDGFSWLVWPWLCADGARRRRRNIFVLIGAAAAQVIENLSEKVE